MGAERRKAKRTSFFQLGGPRGIEPVWIIQYTTPEAILGLLVDIGVDGVQILTHRESVLDCKSYQLMVHTDQRELLMTAIVSPKWAKPEGTLYSRSGFALEQSEDARAGVDKIISSRQDGQTWLRCELLPV